ncbi:DNA glycosylase AlkZ-like family protein [Rhodococcus oryzae]|uniref:DNA glycosylase AlkZ-like family protein n=1 Tax=Rhodococcus oryzae TaxID=2571143 RepID=UPI0037140E25
MSEPIASAIRDHPDLLAQSNHHGRRSVAARQNVGGTAVEARTSDVVAFRLHAHHLTDRQPTDGLHEIAGACGIQNSPPGSALLALHARVVGVTQDRMDRLVGEEKSLLQTWCMRGSPFYFPTRRRSRLHHGRPADHRDGSTASDRRRRPRAERTRDLRSPAEARGVRLLPPRDPYTQMRDRDTIVDQKHHREVWKTVGEPGAVLADGTIVGIWRPRKSGRTLTLTVTTFRSLGTELRKQLHEEADHVAELRGATAVQVEFER